MRKALEKGLLVVLLPFFLEGCAAAPLALLPMAIPALVSGVGGGISYTFTNIAYKTTARPIGEVEKATMDALEKMSIRVTEKKTGSNNVEIKGRTREHVILITLEKMTDTLTKMSVNAKRGLVFKDKTTAYEIIYQTDLMLLGPAAQAGKGGEVPGETRFEASKPER